MDRSESGYCLQFVLDVEVMPQKWTHPETSGIGAGVDSFFEYALKWYIMSGASCYWQ